MPSIGRPLVDESQIKFGPSASFFFLISNKTLLIRKKRHPSTQGIYKGEQIKNENYKSQVNPKEKKNGFSKQRTIQVRFGKEKLDVGDSTLRVFKASIIPLLPDAPHQARRNNLPNNSVVKMTKVTLPASKETNH